MCKKNFKSYVNQKIGRLTIKEIISNTGNRTKFICQCECGNQITVSADRILSGHTLSCGCLQSETRKQNGVNSKKHGFVNSPLYYVHNSMVQRCENANNQAFSNYGGRGISVCDEWHDVKTFCEWALTHGYRHGLSIDRINNGGNYEPTNCRWATMKEQGNNRRTCLKFRTREAAEKRLEVKNHA